MYRICCLFPGEVLGENIHKEKLYRRYFRFYFSMHLLYLMIGLVEFLFLLKDSYAIIYLLVFIFIALDLAGLTFIEFKDEPGPPKNCLAFTLATSILTLLLFSISRVDLYTEYTSLVAYMVFMTIWSVFFVIMKCRSIYHIYKFLQYSKEEKTMFYLSQQTFVDTTSLIAENTGVVNSSAMPYSQMMDHHYSVVQPLDRHYSTSSIDSVLRRETKDFMAPSGDMDDFENDRQKFSYVPRFDDEPKSKPSVVLDEHGKEFGERHYSFVAIGGGKKSQHVANE